MQIFFEVSDLIYLVIESDYFPFNKMPSPQAMCFTSSKIKRIRRTQEMWRGRRFLDVDIRRTGRNHHNFFVP